MANQIPPPINTPLLDFIQLAGPSGDPLQIFKTIVDRAWLDYWRNLGGSGGGGCSVCGHVIEGAGLVFTQRGKLNFTGAGAVVSDDSVNGATVVNIAATATNIYVNGILVP